MNILTYFEKGPGTEKIKGLVLEIVQSAAKNIGLDHTHLDKIAIAESGKYGRAIEDLSGDYYTDNKEYFGLGKTISKTINNQLQHSIVFNSRVFDAVFDNISSKRDKDLSKWDIEPLCFYYAIPHELGHCRDHDERKVETDTKSLNFSEGFDLASVHEHYSDILIDEVCACIFADKYYTQEMINHQFLSERAKLNKSYDELRKTLAKNSDQDNLFPLAARASEWIWLYQIKFAKHVISSSYRTSDNFRCTPLADILQNCEEGHTILMQAIDLIIDDYPDITQEVKELLNRAWIQFTLSVFIGVHSCIK